MVVPSSHVFSNYEVTSPAHSLTVLTLLYSHLSVGMKASCDGGFETEEKRSVS